MRLRRLVIGTIVTAAASAGLPAHAAGGPPVGSICDYAANGPTAENGWTGFMDGGPLVAPGSAISIRCSIHVGNNTHSGAAVPSATATAEGTDVVVLPPTPITYFADDNDLVAMCTEATVDGTTWYASGGRWTTDSATPCVGGGSSVLCVERVEDVQGCLPPLDVVCDLLRTAGSVVPDVPGVAEIEDDGDLWIGQLSVPHVTLQRTRVWDCAPYGD